LFEPVKLKLLFKSSIDTQNYLTDLHSYSVAMKMGIWQIKRCRLVVPSVDDHLNFKYHISSYHVYRYNCRPSVAKKAYMCISNSVGLYNGRRECKRILSKLTEQHDTKLLEVCSDCCLNLH